MALSFLPIDIEKTRELCIRFRRDTAIVSFGHDRDIVDMPGGVDGYIDKLREWQSRLPGGCVHAFESSTIVGQIELDLVQEDARTIGFVRLFYIVPERRGFGLGRELDRYASDFFEARNLSEMRLRVAITNTAARNFYRAVGWTELGTSATDARLLVMTKKLRASAQ